MSEDKSAARTLLVVDDYDDSRGLIALDLKSEGYRVVEAENGRDAIDVARRERPDLILMDLSLPALDGLSATCRIRETKELEGVPVVAFSAHQADTHRAAALAVGCDDYLEKPIDMDVLKRVVARLLTRAEGEGGGHYTEARRPKIESSLLSDDELQNAIDRLLSESTRAPGE
ncbi:MAG: response regulator [Acidobacteria bacterium]|nr:response regulator [Acidobacteriota bacterium]